MISNSQILLTGVGSYLPKNKTSNFDLEKLMNTSDDWITKRTGIKFRHFVEDDQFTSDMGTNAAQLAILDAGLPPIFAWRLARGLEFAEKADDPTHVCER